MCANKSFAESTCRNNLSRAFIMNLWLNNRPKYTIKTYIGKQVLYFVKENVTHKAQETSYNEKFLIGKFHLKAQDHHLLY